MAIMVLGLPRRDHTKALRYGLLGGFAFRAGATTLAVYLIRVGWVKVLGGLGGILGIVAMRLVAGQLIALVQQYPALVDGAFVIIAWIGLKLCLEYFHDVHIIALEIPRWLSLGIVVVIFVIALIYARTQGAVEHVDRLTEEAEEILAAENDFAAKGDGDVTE